jgi:hypothetical protein
MLNGLHGIYLPHILNILRSSYIFSSRASALHQLLNQAFGQLKRPLGFGVEDGLTNEKHMMEHEDVDMDLDEGSGNVLLNPTGALVVEQTTKIRGCRTGSRKARHYSQNLYYSLSRLL